VVDLFAQGDPGADEKDGKHTATVITPTGVTHRSTAPPIVAA
jgi:hypothetical protein